MYTLKLSSADRLPTEYVERYVPVLIKIEGYLSSCKTMGALMLRKADGVLVWVDAYQSTTSNPELSDPITHRFEETWKERVIETADEITKYCFNKMKCSLDMDKHRRYMVDGRIRDDPDDPYETISYRGSTMMHAKGMAMFIAYRLRSLSERYYDVAASLDEQAHSIHESDFARDDVESLKIWTSDIERMQGSSNLDI